MKNADGQYGYPHFYFDNYLFFAPQTLTRHLKERQLDKKMRSSKGAPHLGQ